MKQLYILMACFMLIGSLSAFSIEKTGDNTLRYMQNAQKYADVTLLNKYHIQDGKIWLDDCNMLECSMLMRVQVSNADLNINKLIGKATGRGSFIRNEYQTTQTTTWQEPIYSYNVTQVWNANNSSWSNLTTQYISGYINRSRNDTVWLPFTANKLNANTVTIIRQTFTKPDYKETIDLVPSLNGVDFSIWAWWNTSDDKRYPQNNSMITAAIPCIVNNTNGVNIGGGIQYFYTQCQPTSSANIESLYFPSANPLLFAMANDTTQLPMAIRNGTGANYNPKSVFSGYRAVLLMNETSGTTAYDVLGAYNFSSNVSVFQSGMFGSAYNFTGNVRISTSSSVGFTSDTSRTFIMWMKPNNNAPATEQNVWASTITEQHVCYRLYLNSGGLQASRVRPGTAEDKGTAVAAPTGWLQVAVRWDSATGNLSLFINGVEKTSRISSGAGSSTCDLVNVVGNIESLNGVYYNGLASDLLIINSSLSNTAINQSYENAIGTAGYGDLGAIENISGNLTVNYTTGGTATGNNSTFTPPANLTINASISAGYHFVNWTTNCNGTISSPTSLNTVILVNDATSCFAQANFLNSAPNSVIATTTNSTGGSTYYKGSILGYLLAVDRETTPLTYYFTWYTNGIANGTGSGSIANNTNTLINTVSETLRGQTWHLSTSVYDGVYNVTNASANVTIQDSPPTAPSLLSPSNGEILYTVNQSNITLSWSASTDIDNDTVMYTYCVNATCANTTDIFAIVLLNASSTYTWNVSASDGNLTANSTTWTFRIEQIVPPIMSAISVTPNPTIFNQTAYCSVTAISDSNMTAYWYFYVNFLLTESGSSAILNNTPTNVGTLGSGNFSYGDTLLCQAFVYNQINSANMSSNISYVTGASNRIPVLPITTLVYNFFQVWGWIFFSILAMAVGYLSVRQISSAFFVASGLMIAVAFTFGGSLTFIVAIIYLVAGVITRFSGQ